MTESEFLTADEMGPFGRLVTPGELRVLSPRDVRHVRAEREWIASRYLNADRSAEAMRKRLTTAHMGRGDSEVREWFIAWTIEAAKLALCDFYLNTVAQLLEQGREQALNPSKKFDWAELPQVQELVQRVINASDTEIISGARFRVTT